MQHKILKHLLTLFFVLILLTIFGMQWSIAEKDPGLKEAMQKEAEYYRFIMPPQKNQIEVKIY